MCVCVASCQTLSRMQMAQDPLPPLLSHHFREKNGERGKMRRTDEWNRRTYQTSEAIATHTNVQRSRRQGSEGWSEGGGGGKAPGKWVRPVCHPRHMHTVCSPLRGTQTVQHAAERRDDRRRGRRRRGEAKGKKKCDEVEGCRWIAGLERKRDICAGSDRNGSDHTKTYVLAYL